MKSIAVLLSVHNRCEHTHRCLSQLYKASIPSNYILHIYITDDGCTDGTPEMINKLYSNINLIKGNGNLFWNRGMYTAWNEAAKKDYDFYLWLMMILLYIPTYSPLYYKHHYVIMIRLS